MIYTSPAKINVFLNVIGKRPDGFHLLESLFIPVTVHDEMLFTLADAISCDVDGPLLENNLITKAANKLRELSGKELGVDIKIKKNIPIGAGLGGGSSNAATTLKALNKLWELGLTTQRLKEIGLELGADVPFFIDCVPAFVQGIGEIITPYPLKQKLHILLVNPNVHVSTPIIFKMGFAKYSPTITDIENEILHGKNDLQPNAIAICPEIQQVLDFIASQEGIMVSRMSGSGATCFGLFDSESSLKKAYEKTPLKWRKSL